MVRKSRLVVFCVIMACTVAAVIWGGRTVEPGLVPKKDDVVETPLKPRESKEKCSSEKSKGKDSRDGSQGKDSSEKLASKDSSECSKGKNSRDGSQCKNVRKCSQGKDSRDKSKDNEKTRIDYIKIHKSARLMQTYANKKLIGEYKISLGFAPKGKKKEEGDGKTPEGTYCIVSKNPGSQYYRSLLLSYPNEKDKKQARKHGKKPGGEICIHGISASVDKNLWPEFALNDWTYGCIAVNNNHDIEKIFRNTPVGTKVEICK
jgi:lipoprotein-anchoring transpeptidase ErfK/SrfK